MWPIFFLFVNLLSIFIVAINRQFIKKNHHLTNHQEKIKIDFEFYQNFFLFSVLCLSYGILGIISYTYLASYSKFIRLFAILIYFNCIMFWGFYLPFKASALRIPILIYIYKMLLSIFSPIASLLYPKHKTDLEDLKHQAIQKSFDHITAFHTKLSEAMISFNDLIVREVMIPKVDIFALQETTPILNALTKILEEGYSRVPIYKKNIDEITGVILLKDLIKAINTHPNPESIPLATIATPALFSPELKKATLLLQELRQKHRHLAIVVNEYGCTEGLVTMEDIIEEIIGEISDEYDSQELIPYKKVGSSWIVDGRMNISDVEELLHCTIQHENSYDTLSGYVFHKIGSAPTKGTKIHHENFDIEVISCTERSIGKLKISPRKESL